MRPITWAFAITSYSLDLPECAGNTLGVFIVPPAITSDDGTYGEVGLSCKKAPGEVEPRGLASFVTAGKRRSRYLKATALRQATQAYKIGIQPICGSPGG